MFNSTEGQVTPRITFRLIMKGDKDMDYKIVQKDSFMVTGKILAVSTKDGENFKRIPKFWEECNSNGTSEKLCTMLETGTMLGICMDMDHQNEQFNYMVAVEGNKPNNEFVAREIPAATWAIFTSIGPMPHAIQRVWQRIFGEFFPTTSFEHAEAPELEVYLEGNPMAEDYKCEVWIPVIKK